MGRTPLEIGPGPRLHTDGLFTDAAKAATTMGHSEVPAQDGPRVRRALESLGRDKSAAIWLTYFGGLDCRQVAIELGLPEGTIRTYVRDGLIHLRQHLAEPAEPRG